jgi:hypothetical protein
MLVEGTSTGAEAPTQRDAAKYVVASVPDGHGGLRHRRAINSLRLERRQGEL